MKSVVITGASRGVGLATAKIFLENGHIVYAASRNLEPLRDLKEEFRERLIPVLLDLENAESFAQLVNSIQQNSGSLDFLIHNAGYLVNKPFLEIGESELVRSYAINLFGPYMLTQRLFPLLSSNAHIVSISSMGGFQGSVKFPGLTAYSSSKAAIASLTECWQAEFAGYSQTFNCLCLGAVQTEMLEEAFPGYRAPLTPEAISSFIYQFTTTAYGYMRGKIIPVFLTTP